MSVLKRHLDIFLVFALALVCWFGWLDLYAESYINDSLVTAGSSFGVAKLFNATVSVLSTITLNMPIVGSIQIGELLDPLNDLVEDFSSVMKYVISSLLIQKFLVEILQTLQFKIVLIVTAILFVLTKWVAKPSHSFFYKCFLLSVLCKFSVAGVAVATSIIDATFLESKIVNENNTLEAFPVAPEQLDTVLDLSSDLRLEIKNNLQQVEEQRQQSLLELNRLALEKETLQNELQVLKEKQSVQSTNTSAFTRIFSEKTEEQKTLDRLRQAKMQQMNLVLDEIAQFKSNLQEAEERISTLESQLSEGVSAFTLLKDGFKQVASNAKEKIFGYVNSLNQSMDHFLNLIALFVLKTILIPLLFSYLLYKAFIRIWLLPVSRNLSRADPAVR